jgi:hypothetical protein
MPVDGHKKDGEGHTAKGEHGVINSSTTTITNATNSIVETLDKPEFGHAVGKMQAEEAPAAPKVCERVVHHEPSL